MEIFLGFFLGMTITLPAFCNLNTGGFFFYFSCFFTIFSLSEYTFYSAYLNFSQNVQHDHGLQGTIKNNRQQLTLGFFALFF